MIISHKLKVIYIKLRKVGGSSFEIALSRYCGPNDILTKILGGGERIRTALGFIGAQNYEAFKIKKRIEHLGANQIRTIISANTFDDYLKIATIRNPYEKAISWYFWRKRREKRTEVKEDFEEFIISECLNNKNNPLMDYDLIHIEGKSVVDSVIRYEHLSEDIKQLEKKIACRGLLETFSGIHAKTKHRPKQETSLYRVYSEYPRAKLLIDRMHDTDLDKYELLRKYYPIYKSELEHMLSDSS